LKSRWRAERGCLKEQANRDEYQHQFHRVERKVRDPRIVAIVADPDQKIDSKDDFSQRENLKGVAEALAAQGIKAELKRDEEHSAWIVCYRDATQAERCIDIELAALPEYKRLRSLARQIAARNKPPFVVVKEASRQTLENWRDLLEFVKGEGMKDAQIQRYKGLGEMNADQLWETTMNAEKRTLLQVRSEDAGEANEIFTTLMGEDVEHRRRFIEENALDVRNLDV
jgi:DNA gyrase subunit B